MAVKRRRGMGNRTRANAKDHAAAAEREDRRAKAVRLRIHGLNIREIAAQLGIGHSQAHEDVTRGLAERGEHTRDELRQLSNGVLDAVVQGHLQRAKLGQVQSAQVVVKAVAVHARINGYEAPKLVEVAGKDGGPIQTSVTLEELTSAMATAVRNESADDPPAAEPPPAADAKR